MSSTAAIYHLECAEAAFVARERAVARAPGSVQRLSCSLEARPRRRAQPMGLALIGAIL